MAENALRSPFRDIDAEVPLTVSIANIEQVFGSAHVFHLPWFQRAYAWNEEHALRLLGDIIEAMENKRAHYFLGHILLAAPRGEVRTALIDGHQRSVTLTLIFALLRDRASTAEDRERMEKLITNTTTDDNTTTDNSGKLTKAPFHLSPQKGIADFLAYYVQKPGATARNPEDEGAQQSQMDLELNIIENRNRLAAMLDEFEARGGKWRDLTDFLLKQCYIIVERVENETEAWNMLAVEEATGLPFHSSERLKYSLIAVMPRAEQEEVGRLWDMWQAKLGKEAMSRLIYHIRSIIIGHRTTQPVEHELARRLKLDKGGIAFINDIVAPHAERYSAILERRLGSSEQRRKISNAIDHMVWLEKDFWVVPVLSWLSIHGDEHDDTVAFFEQLERLAWMLRISGNDPVHHERRFNKVSSEIAEGLSLDKIKALQIEPVLSQATRSNLLSRTLYDKRYCKVVLRRICSEHGRDPGPVDGNNVTVEHVLPRNPEKDSGWRRHFKSEASIKKNVNRLGNLTLLTFSENQRAAVHPYTDKRLIMKDSDLAISQVAAKVADWTPSAIEERSEAMTRLLFDAWRLPFGKS